MFSESAIGQHLLDNHMCAEKITVMKNLLLFSLAVRFSFIYFKSGLHQIIQAKFMPPKQVCLQLETLALITCCDAFL